jgi:3-hydroxyacyl-CoA dehydrogenase
MPVHFECSDGVAIATIDNPPVNAIDRHVRQGLLDAMDLARTNNARRMIITGRGAVFVAGADTREFDVAPQPPHLNDVLNLLASFPIPVISAINGAALGGGLEIALASHYRIAASRASMGLPEVTLGIVPGAGGTQRLARLIGISTAVDMIGFGKTVDAEEAKAMGLVDALSDDPLATARSMDEAILKRAVPTDLRPPPASDDASVAAAMALAGRRLPSQHAPSRAIRLVAASATLPIAEGLSHERETFLELRASDQARALRHVFFSERAALSQSKQFPRPNRDIATALVVGGGNMGAAIAYALATGGIEVTVIETNEEARTRAEANVSRIVEQGVSRGLLTAKAADDIKARFGYKVGYEAVAPVDLAIEAAFEDMEVKRAIFDALAKSLPEHTILATNTSYLDVNQLAEGIPVPGRFLGLHFFSPAHIMKLLEIVRGDKTSPETLGTAFALAKTLKKIPVLSGVCDGFIGNRILSRYRQAADILLLEGASPSQVDAAMRNFGMAMGPYEAQDLSGLDIAYANRKRQDLRNRTDIRYVPLADRLVEENERLGRKSGAGWYDYRDGKPLPSPIVDAQLLRASQEANIERRYIPEHEITRRILSAMIAEATEILDEGIAQRPRDIDLVLVHGYGFPRWRGGLMHYADSLTPTAILSDIQRLAAIDPLSWSAPPLLARLALDGLSFDSLNQE